MEKFLELRFERYLFAKWGKKQTTFSIHLIESIQPSPSNQAEQVVDVTKGYQ